MQERLAVFKELNVIRTIARVTYAVCFVSSCPFKKTSIGRKREWFAYGR
jgi:hypothetical protein